MDISPIIISMKTATIAILFTFILGLLAARWILYRKSDATRIFWDGIFTEQIDEDLIFAARTLGMSEWSIFFRVMIPNALPGIISGGVLAFARGFGEFGATAMIAGNIPGRTRTLPLAVYSEVAAGNMDAAYQYVLVIVIICFAIVAAMNIYLIMEKKKQEA